MPFNLVKYCILIVALSVVAMLPSIPAAGMEETCGAARTEDTLQTRESLLDSSISLTSIYLGIPQENPATDLSSFVKQPVKALPNFIHKQHTDHLNCFKPSNAPDGISFSHTASYLYWLRRMVV